MIKYVDDALNEHIIAYAMDTAGLATLSDLQ